MDMYIFLFNIFIGTVILSETHAELKVPRGFEKGGYCYGCQCLIKEFYKTFDGVAHDDPAVKTKVYEEMDGICSSMRFRSYEFIPPKMVKMCQHLTETNPEGMEDILLAHFKKKDRSKDELTQAICYELIPTCDEDSISLDEYEKIRKEKYKANGGARVVTSNGEDFDPGESNDDLKELRDTLEQMEKQGEEIRNKLQNKVDNIQSKLEENTADDEKDDMKKDSVKATKTDEDDGILKEAKGEL